MFSGALARDAGEDVAGGPYAIRQGTLAANSNYNVIFTTGQLTITPRALTVTADNKTKLAGAALPPLTATYQGFAFADTPANLNGALTIATTANSTSTAGLYVITPSGQSSGNYAITYIDANKG